MQIMPREEAQELLEPHSPILKEIYITAWQKLCQLPPELSFPISPRSRACFIYDYVCHEAKHRFEGVVGVSVTDYPDFLVLNFYNSLLMRFKMLDDCLHASNILTRKQRVYNDQTKQLELSSIPPLATRVIAGYQLNRAQTDIKDILITCPQANNIEWYFSIFGDGPDTLQGVLPIDEPPMSGPKIRAKNTRKTSTE